MEQHDPDLEDWAFGAPNENMASVTPTTRISDIAAGYMIPFVGMLVLVAVLSYSTCKTIEYHELIRNNKQYRNVILACNAALVCTTTVLISYAVHKEACSYK